MTLGFNLRFRDDVPQYEDHTNNASKDENKIPELVFTILLKFSVNIAFFLKIPLNTFFFCQTF